MDGYIFISYAREDKDFGFLLGEKLKQQGVPIWLDQWNIRAGANWDKAIDKAISSCAKFLILLSPSALESREIRNELYTALREEKLIIPVLYKPCPLPRQLRTLQYIDLTSGGLENKNAFDHLMYALEIPEAPREEEQEELEPSRLHDNRIPKLRSVEEGQPKIFLAYAHEDEEKVQALYSKLSAAGFKPWMAAKDILPGEQWEVSIQNAIRGADFCLVLLSKSAGKRGFLQNEIRRAMDVRETRLARDIYLIPARLEECEVPEILRAFHRVDLFMDKGWDRLIQAIHVGLEQRSQPLQRNKSRDRTQSLLTAVLERRREREGFITGAGFTLSTLFPPQSDMLERPIPKEDQDPNSALAHTWEKVGEYVRTVYEKLREEEETVE